MRSGWIWRALSLVSVALLLALGALVLRHTSARETLGPAAEHVTLVIDAGHGGEDGGASGADGTVESTVNLAVARRLEAVLALCGRESVMLRTEDVSLHSPEASTIREKKVSDLHNRADMVNAQEAPWLISIHQNHFPSAQYHGAQVFYANGPLGEPWARRTQQNLRDCLDPENDRQAKPISHNVYLMNHITCPAILVECGFLSNPGETAKLNDPGYQTKLALVIGASCLQELEAEGAA